jgi:ketosteroid isomerase-like protein
MPLEEAGMTHPNEDVVRRAYEAFQKEDLDTLKGLVAPDVVWHEAGNPEPIRGREALSERMSGAAGLDNDIDLHDLIASDDHVVSLIRARLRKPNGDEVSYPVVEVAHVRDGMITERWSFMDACPEDVTAFFATLG